MDGAGLLAAWGSLAILAAHLTVDSLRDAPNDLEKPLMSPETLEFLLLLSGWIVSFLLGRELLTGIRQVRLRLAEQRARRED